MTLTKAHFERARQAMLDRHGPDMGDNDRAFVARTYGADPQVYLDRLAAIGLDQGGEVLDAGCGFGQWSLCLAALGASVLAVDCSALRTGCTQAALEALDLPGRALPGETTALPAPDASADAVFCYGALFCTAWRQSLAEFARVLRPGGSLYFSANDVGYIVNMWRNRPNRTSDFDPREAAARTFMNTLAYERDQTPPAAGQILIDPADAREELERLGFENIRVAPEGTLNLAPGRVTPTPFFRAEYDGLPGCYEVLAAKR